MFTGVPDGIVLVGRLMVIFDIFHADTTGAATDTHETDNS
jgi:hypothetical protein